MTKPSVEIYTDGACANNPGPGGYGIIMKYTDTLGNAHKKEFSKGFSMTTNNRMELLAVIDALKLLKKPCNISLYSDSKYVTDAINQKWLEGWIKKGWKKSSNTPVKNTDLWLEFLKVSKSHDIKFIWVKGHSTNEFNQRCDKLAVQARSSNNLETDKGFIPES